MKTFSRFLPVLALVAFAGIAFAAVTVTREDRVMHFKNGMFIGSGAAVAANKVTKSLSNGPTGTTYDAASITATCTESSGITVAGAAVSDACSVGVPAAVGALNLAPSCYVSAANTVKVKLCNPTAGAIDAASGTYFVRVTSSQ